MNWKNDTVRRGTKKAFVVDFLLNIKYIAEVGLRIYLINFVFMPVAYRSRTFYI